MLGGLLLWAGHFFGLYIIASIFLTSTTSRVLALVLTIPALVAGVLLLRRAYLNRERRDADGFGPWADGLALAGAALALVAICWQALAAILV